MSCFLTVILIDFKNFRKIKEKETRFAWRTNLPNDQTLDKKHDLTLKQTFLLLNQHYENDMHVNNITFQF